MDAHVVIGANYGDEGKGLMTDYLARQHDAHFVVRFNGGAQAGHTVVDGDMRHVFSHFSSGTFAGAKTFLSEFFVCNPILFQQEAYRLHVPPSVWVDGRALVTTPFDMLINQEIENSRTQRHGSCGVGFNETIERCSTQWVLRAMDVFHADDLRSLVIDIMRSYVPIRCASLGLDQEATLRCMDERMIDPFMQSCEFFRDHCRYSSPLRIAGSRVVFEGAQGLLLDQHNRADFPHLTRSNTGCQNVAKIAAESGIDRLHLVYASRSYLTRHGAGPLPNEWEETPAGLIDDTNVPHPFQGTLRYAPMDWSALISRVAKDTCHLPMQMIGSTALAVTCQDQMPADFASSYISHGPSASDVMQCREVKALAA